MAYNIRPAIEEELNKISMSNNRFFDSHYIIKRLLEKHTNDYFSYIASIAPENETKNANNIHGLLAQEIGKCTSLVSDTGNDISTENIKGELSPCRVWEKIK